MNIVLVELFSGIGGFAKGLTDAGFNITNHLFSEIDKYAIANYKYNFPNAEYIGSVVDVSGTSIRERFPNEFIVVTFGFPCQDNSIAGKRKGTVRGTRSGLLFESGRICLESKCELFVAENVKGLYSVNGGEDFQEALRFLTYLDTDSPQYTVEQQLLNTSWLLPQNRERTYFVGHRFPQSNKRIFPIFVEEKKVDYDYKFETMFTVQKETINSILRERQEDEGWEEKFLQRMFKRILQEIQSGKLIEHSQEPVELRQKSEGDLQEIKIFTPEGQETNRDSNGGLYRMVQLPTEEVLLLWFNGGETSIEYRFLQPEDLSFNCGSNRFRERLFKGKYSTLLFAVQSYKGKLFYSIGDGRNWEKIHIKKMVEICNTTLSHILEQEVIPEYFLSQKRIAGLLKGQATPQLLEL